MAGKNYAIFSAQYPPHLGGIENFTERLSHALALRGNEVTVVTNDTNGVGVGVHDEDGVSVVRLPCLPLVSGRLPLFAPTPEGRHLRKMLAEKHFDGVLVNARFYPHSLYGMRLARHNGLRPVVLDHGSAYLSFSNALIDPLVRFYERAATLRGRKYDAAYYGISQKSADWLRTFGITAEGVIPNAIDAGEYRACASKRDYRVELGLSREAFVVAFAGRLIPEKGVRQLIESSHNQKLRDRDVVFVLAGDGSLADKVHSSEGEGLRWLGRLSRADTSALFQQANAMCLPTRSEGFSTTLLEASACGCPSIVTDVGGAREIIPDKQHGTILPSADASNIISAILQLINSEELRKEQSHACQSLVERSYTWDKTAELLEIAFNKL